MSFSLVKLLRFHNKDRSKTTNYNLDWLPTRDRRGIQTSEVEIQEEWECNSDLSCYCICDSHYNLHFGQLKPSARLPFRSWSELIERLFHSNVLYALSRTHRKIKVCSTFYYATLPRSLLLLLHMAAQKFDGLVRKLAK